MGLLSEKQKGQRVAVPWVEFDVEIIVNDFAKYYAKFPEEIL